MINPLVKARHERGAIAVMTAIMMSGLLLVVAAIGVDLGNAWSRKLTVQKSVDVSALSAAYLLPRTSANEGQIYQEVANYLNKVSNKVQGQQAAPITAAQLHDNNVANGEVTFTTNPLTNLDDKMKVVAPNADVNFAFTGAFGGPADADVTGEATVQVRTPLPDVEDVLPMWLPATCVYGPLAGDVAANPPPDGSPSYTGNSPRGNHEALPATSPAAVAYATTGVTVRVSIENIPANRTWAVVRFTFGDTQYVDYLVDWAAQGATTNADNNRFVDVFLDDPNARRVPDGATVTNPNDNWTITSTAGKWEVWPLIPTTNAAKPTALPVATPSLDFPKMNKQAFFEVTGGGEVACNEHQRGNFGQLDSPRLGVSQKTTAYARNVAFGLDHELAAFATEPAKYECPSDGDPVGALIDNISSNGRNCLYVDPGNDPEGLTAGLLGGGHGVNQGEGRLEKPTNPRCGRTDLTYGSHNYNNDTLSCFLKPGYTLADVAKDSDVDFDAFDMSIFESPRFFWVPVVYQGDRMLKKYLAIKTFAPVFLTDEYIDAAGVYHAAGPNNGLVLNPANKVQSVQIFGFNEVALPVKPNAPTTDYQNGTRSVVRLVN